MISIDIDVILCVYLHYFAGVHLFYDWGLLYHARPQFRRLLATLGIQHHPSIR